MSLPTRICFTLCLAFLGLVAVSKPVLAGDFKADYSVNYSLNTQTALTHVKQVVVLTNQAANLRASSYSLTLEKNGYQHLTAFDSSGALKYQETKAADGTPTLTFTFNDRIVGVGNQLKWTIEYDSPTLIQKHGQIWDVTIPRVNESSSYDINSYAVALSMPKSVGPALYISPSAANMTDANTLYTYTFNKDQVLPTGIVAAFGPNQVFRFTLKYHLQNPNIGQASTEIALPADVSGYQQIVYDQLSPQPVSLRTDADGNSLATYYLSPHASQDVTFTGWAIIKEAQNNLTSTKTAKDIPTDLVKTYTTGQQYWETYDPDLIKQTKAITDPNKPAVQNARAIYNYVTSTLQYNTARINKDLKRMGAAAAIKDPKDAVCMEFTDVFVTMARIAGIPAREVDGYAYTTDAANQPIFYPGLGSDILHAWAQIYLPDAGWVMVDPTWGSTTGGVDYFGRIDLNRIAFVTKGISSQTPYAAGSYKTNSQQDGDVKVSFSDSSITGKTGLSMAMDGTDVISGLGSSVPLKLTNTGQVALYNVNLQFAPASPLSFSRTPTTTVATLLPGQEWTDWMPMTTTGWLNHSPANLTVTASAADLAKAPATAQLHQAMNVQPFFGALLGPVAIMLLVVILALSGGWFGLHKAYDHQEKAGASKPEVIEKL